MIKKLFKISQSVNRDYNAYFGAVVCAKSEDDAIKIHPDKYLALKWKNNDWYYKYPDGVEMKYDGYHRWVNNIKDVKVDELGIANDNINLNSVICSSGHTG